MIPRNLSNNKLNGTIPKELGKLVKLQYLYVLHDLIEVLYTETI